MNGSNGSHNIGAGSIGSRLHNSIEHEPTHIQHRCSVDSNKRNTRLISLSNTLKTKQQQQSKARSTQCSAPRPTYSVFRKMCGRPFLGSAPSFPKKLRIYEQSVPKRSNPSNTHPLLIQKTSIMRCPETPAFHCCPTRHSYPGSTETCIVQTSTTGKTKTSPQAM